MPSAESPELVSHSFDTVGGIAAPSVTAGGKGFIVENNDQFLNLSAALGRSCDVQVSFPGLVGWRASDVFTFCSTTSVPIKRTAEEVSLLASAIHRIPSAMREFSDRRSTLGRSGTCAKYIDAPLLFAPCMSDAYTCTLSKSKLQLSSTSEFLVSACSRERCRWRVLT